MNIEEILEVPIQLDESDLKEQLNILVSSGKCKEMIGKDFNHEQINKLSEEEVKKFHKRFETALASKTTDAVADSAIKLATKMLGLALPIDDQEQLQKDILEDYVIAQELKMTCGWLSMKCGKLMAVASAALHVAQHIDLNKLAMSWKDFKELKGLSKSSNAVLQELTEELDKSPAGNTGARPNLVKLLEETKPNPQVLEALSSST